MAVAAAADVDAVVSVFERDLAAFAADAEAQGGGRLPAGPRSHQRRYLKDQRHDIIS